MWLKQDQDYCFLHSDEPNKPNIEIKNALERVDGPITGIKLHGIDDGTDLDFTDMSIPRADFSESNLRGVSFDGTNLAGADFSNTDLKSATFSESENSGNKPDLRRARFDGSTCNQTEFQLTDLDGATFRRASIVDTELWGIDGTKIDFTEASIRESRLHQSNLDLSEFVGGVIRDSYFTAAKLSESDFTDCRIINCDFTDANLSGSRFSGTDLDDKTEFGCRLLTEYEADKLAEPDRVHQLLDIPQISDRGYGREADSITKQPPESLFESIPKWPAKINHVACIAFRIWNRHRSRQKEPDSDSSDESLPRQLKALDEAAEVYGSLKSAYRDSPYGDKARKFNVREREAERKRRVLSLVSIRNSLLKWGMWYGESPGHVLKMGVVTWAVAAIVLFWSGFQTPTETIAFSSQGTLRLDVIDDVLLFSLRRLFTFSSGSYTVSGLSEALGIGISAVGKLLGAMLIFTLGRRAVS